MGNERQTRVAGATSDRLVWVSRWRGPAPWPVTTMHGVATLRPGDYFVVGPEGGQVLPADVFEASYAPLWPDAEWKGWPARLFLERAGA